jgi:hypothetical protein
MQWENVLVVVYPFFDATGNYFMIGTVEVISSRNGLDS